MSEALSPAQYRVMPMPLSDEFKSNHSRAWTEGEQNGFGNPRFGNQWGVALLVIAGFLFFGFCLSLLFAPAWRGLVLGLMLLAGAFIAWMTYSNSKQSKAELAQRLHLLQSASHAQLHLLDLNGPHRFVRHEHGVIVLVPIDPGRTFFFDVSNCVDDPLEDEIYNALEAKQVRPRWSWSEIPGIARPQSFEMSGEPIPALLHRDFASADEWIAFADSLGAEYHNPGHILARDFDTLFPRPD